MVRVIVSQGGRSSVSVSGVVKDKGCNHRDPGGGGGGGGKGFPASLPFLHK